MAFSGNEEEPGVGPRALVRYTIFGRRAEPVTAEEAFGEIARAFEAMADAPREEIGAAVEEFQELVDHPEQFSGALLRLIPGGDDPINPTRTTAALFAYAGGESDPPPIQTEENDAEMQAAHDEAMATFDQFKERFRAAQTEESDDAEFMVKISFPTPDGSKELLWAAILDWSEGRITATILTNPENVPDMQGGQEVTVDESEVGDWMIVKQDRTWEGCYTDQVLLRRSGQEMPEKM